MDEDYVSRKNGWNGDIEDTEKIKGWMNTVKVKYDGWMDDR